jgi:hypothetical protein
VFVLNALIMDAVSISETSVKFSKTIRRSVPEDGRHTCRRENLRCHLCVCSFGLGVFINVFNKFV